MSRPEESEAFPDLEDTFANAYLVATEPSGMLDDDESKDPDPASCPELTSPPPEFCPDGVTKGVHNQDGCVVSFECVPK